MKDNYHCFRTADESKIRELLEEWRNNGWNLNNFFIQITHGPGGFHVFYDARLDERQDDMKEERNIEIVKAAAEHGNETGQFCDLVHSSLSNGVNSSYGIGFIEGAVWADRTMVEKVCDFIEENIDDYLYINRDWNAAQLKPEFIKDLIKTVGVD